MLVVVDYWRSQQLQSMHGRTAILLSGVMPTQVVNLASRHTELLVKEALHIRAMHKESSSTQMGDWNSMIAGLQSLGGVNKGANANIINTGHLAP